MTTEDHIKYPRAFPHDFGSWPEESQLEFYVANNYKIGSIRRLLALVDYSREQNKNRKYVTKKELGAIELRIRGYR